MLIRIILCVLILAAFLYGFIDHQNQIVTLRLQIPDLQKTVMLIEQENNQLQFQVDQFESPSHLIEWKKEPQYRHLKEPLEDAIIMIP